MQKSLSWSDADCKLFKKLPIPCTFCIYWITAYSPTFYGKVPIHPLIVNMRDPDILVSPVAKSIPVTEYEDCKFAYVKIAFIITNVHSLKSES